MKKTTILALLLFAALPLLPANDAEPFGPKPEWISICDDVTATIYHAVPSQCNADVTHTASMKTIDPSRAGEYRILAMERTMMARYGISYGDTVLVTGTQSLDGKWVVEDTMNKRFAGMNKIDLLVDKSQRYGKWEGVTVSIKNKH